MGRIVAHDHIFNLTEAIFEFPPQSQDLWPQRAGARGGWLSDIISVVVQLDFLGGPAKGKVDWNPLNV